jgi:hypothetical protein
MKRMMDDYYDRFYFPLGKSQKAASKSNWKAAKELAAWKQSVIANWQGIEVVDSESFDTVNKAFPLGDVFNAKVVLDTNGIDAKNLLLEACFYERLSEEKIHLRHKEAFKLKKQSDGKAFFEISLDPRLAGVYEYGFRLRPNHKMMPHAQDLNLLFWV